MSGDLPADSENASALAPEARTLRLLEARAKQQAALASLSQRALALPEPQELFEAAVQLCAAALGAEICTLTEMIADTGELRLLSSVGIPLSPGEPLSQLDLRIEVRAIESVEPVRVDDWLSAPATAPMMTAGIRSSACVPLIRSGQAVGALVLHRRQHLPFDEQDVSFLQSIANLAGGYGERRAHFARMQLGDRLAAVGTLASGVAHEMNNPLTYVLANLQFLEEELLALSTPAHILREGELRRALEALREAREGAQRLTTIVRDLRTFSSGDSEMPTLVSLVPVVLSSVNVAQAELRNRARLELDVAPVPMVRGNAARLGQVCLNLLVNATQSIAPGEPEKNQVAVRTRLSENGEIALEVSDTGSGIAPIHLKRIFDPFFTTKAPGVGSGLGLAICHGIVESMGGRIEVESQPGRGSTFRVLLPAAATGLAAKNAPPARLNRGRVLLVEDEPLVGMAIRRALIAEHDVVLVQSGRAALEELAAEAHFDALVSDVMMPEMSGLELHERLSLEQPALAKRTLFISGGSLSSSAREQLARPGMSLLQKPVAVDVLRRAVRKLVAS